MQQRLRSLLSVIQTVSLPALLLVSLWGVLELHRAHQTLKAVYAETLVQTTLRLQQTATTALQGCAVRGERSE
jgi:hypothetical protein